MGMERKLLNGLISKHYLLDSYFSLHHYEVYGIANYKDNIYKSCKYPDIIWNYLETNDIPDKYLNQFDTEDELRKDLDSIKCENHAIRLKLSQYYLKNPSEFLPKTTIVDKQYDNILKKWTGDYKFKLLYKASEHENKSRLFHECCDDKGPTLTIIKSTEGWIFGGYTTQSWICSNDITRIYIII